MSRVLLYWNTVRHLRPIQVYGRFARAVRHPSVDASPAPLQREVAGRWRGSARRSCTDGESFRFLGERRTIATASDWNRPDVPRLWLYNLHYFDDLVADGAGGRAALHRDLIARWIVQNPPGAGVGWEPYPTSLRIVNWIKWALAGNGLDPDARHSLAVQVRWLRARLETHLLGNHLWANAKALVFAGAYFAGKEAGAWRDEGLRLVRRELAEQILPDGGHFERSPMYHGIVLEDVLDLVQLAGLVQCAPDADRAAWRDVAARMLRWLRVMSHPDGQIAFFNDAAFGIAPDFDALRAYAAQLGVGVDATQLRRLEALPQSGYVRLAAGPAVLIADVGEIGPGYLPGHAHADSLSFELSVAGRRLLVNGGTSTYESGLQRQRERGTAAHNTVCINGEDSSEVWAGFRVARRAHPLDVAWGDDEGTLWLRGAHDGYRRLHGRPLHRREWRLDDHGLIVTDALEGGFDRAEARFHLHPAWLAAATGGRAGTFAPRTHGAGAVPSVGWSSAAAARAVPDQWHPAFGATRPCGVLVTQLSRSAGRTTFAW